MAPAARSLAASMPNFCRSAFLGLVALGSLMLRRVPLAFAAASATFALALFVPELLYRGRILWLDTVGRTLAVPLCVGFGALIQGMVDFNGKDMTGWRSKVSPIDRRKKPETVSLLQAASDAREFLHWSVADGILRHDGNDKGESALETIAEYGDFELYLDWRVMEYKGDSGIELRGYPQVQIWAPERRNATLRNQGFVGSGGLHWNRSGPRYPRFVADLPVGYWNRFYIRMIGQRVTVILNNSQIVDNLRMENFYEREKLLPARGPIGLMWNTGPLEFRNLYVREIGPQGLPEYDE